MPKNKIRPQLSIAVRLSVLVAIAVTGSLYWIRENVVLVGHDASGYLDTTLDYLEFLPPLTPASLFRAVTYDDYRPTALFLAVQPFYALFGPGMDSAQYFNILVLAGLIVLTYLLGSTLARPAIGLYAAALVSFMPLVAAMARLFYTEILLTALVTLCLLALARSPDFHSGVWAAVFGTGLGLGLLTKWTMPIYIGLPLLWLMIKTGRTLLPSRSWMNGRHFAFALSAGGAFTLLLWPASNALITTFPLGRSIYLFWMLLFTICTFVWLSPSSPARNLWGALLLGGVISSLWYLPHADFIQRLLEEDQARGQSVSGPLQLETHIAYALYFYRQHFGPLSFWLIVPVGLFPWIRARITGSSLRPQAAILWLSLLSAYFALILLEQRNARNLVPLTPAIALLLTMGLFAYSVRVRTVFGALWICVLVAQWFLFTTDQYPAVYAHTEPLWVLEDYSRRPASSLNDPGYWIAPDIIKIITAAAPVDQRLGMLVQTEQIHRGVFKYLIDLEHSGLEVKSLTEADGNGWYDLLSAQWLLAKNGDNHNVEGEGVTLLERIAQHDPLFDFFFQPYKTYPLPNGETATLYHRTLGPGRPHDLPLRLEETKIVAHAVHDAFSEHAQLIYANPDIAVWVGIHDPIHQQVTVIPAGADPANVLAERFGTLLVVMDAGGSALRQWLDTQAYRTYEVGNDTAAVAIYGRPATSLLEQPPISAGWPGLQVESLRTLPIIEAGEVLPVEIEFDHNLQQNVKVSYRIVDQTGSVIASHDRPLALADRFGLFAPPITPPGRYEVVAQLYMEGTFDIVQTSAGREVIELLPLIIQP